MTSSADIIGTGLTDAVAAERLAVDGPNELPTDARRNLARQMLDVFREPMLLLLVAAGAINLLLAELLDGLILLVAVFVVVGISIAQEHKTENALAAARPLVAASARRACGAPTPDRRTRGRPRRRADAVRG